MQYNFQRKTFTHDDFSSFIAPSLFAGSLRVSQDDGSNLDNGGGSTAPTPAVPAPTAINDNGEIETVTGLKNTVKSERDRANSLEKQFKQLQESFKGIDPEQYKQFERLQAESEKANQREAELKQTLDTQYTAQLQALQIDLQKSKQAFDGLTKRTQVERVYHNPQIKGRGEAAEDGSSFFEFVYAHADKFMKPNEKGGMDVLDHNGVKRFSKKDASKPMSEVEYFEELKTHPIFSCCFLPASNGKGSGMIGNNGRVMPNQQVDTSRMSTAEKLTRARQALQGM